jgi:hypothetical protein
MVNTEFYKNAKIYKIVDNTNGNIYVGSTCKKLCQRIAQHRVSYKQYLKGIPNYVTSFKIIQNGDYDIILLEEVKDCENKEQLRARERHYIESLDCVNKCIPIRMNEEHKDLKKEYYLENIERIKKQNKEYRDANKDKIKNKSKEYYENNKDKVLENIKNYKKINEEIIKIKNKKYREKIMERRKEKINCPHCNTEVLKREFKRHEKSIKHINNLENSGENKKEFETMIN